MSKRAVLLLLTVIILLGGAYSYYTLKLSPKALRLQSIQQEMTALTQVIAKGNPDEIQKILDRMLAPDATVTLNVSHQALALNAEQAAVKHTYTRSGFLEQVKLVTTNLKGYGMRFTLQQVDFSGGLDSPTATARGEQWAEGNMYQQGGVQSTYKTALECTAKLRIASMQGSHFPTIASCECSMRIQMAPKMDMQNLGRVRDTILLNQAP